MSVVIYYLRENEMSVIGEIQCEQKLLEDNKKQFSIEYVEGYRDALNWILKRILDLKEKGEC